VEHDPTASGQGSGVIWSGSSASAVSNGIEGSVSVPSGKLSDGWKIRWRARATAGSVSGAWSPWHILSVDTTPASVDRRKAVRSTALAADPIGLKRVLPSGKDVNVPKLTYDTCRASTNQSAAHAKPPHNFSVWRIESIQNQRHGNVLDAWYQNNRMLTSDQFWIDIQ
jgi:hypothetical protein